MRNFGLILAVLSGLGAVYVQLFPSIVIILYPIGLLAGFVICVPFVCPNKAKVIAEEYVVKQLPTKPRVVMDRTESDNWTWHVFGKYEGGRGWSGPLCLGTFFEVLN
jgi:hypothetical protein